MSGRTTMVERLATAIKDARAYPGSNPVARLSDVDRRAARAVLASLRDLTPEMIPGNHGDALFAMQWRRSIDAALASDEDTPS